MDGAQEQVNGASRIVATQHEPVRLTVDMAYGSYQFLKQAVANHNAAIMQKHGPNYPRLKFTTLLRSLAGSWMRDKI